MIADLNVRLDDGCTLELLDHGWGQVSLHIGNETFSVDATLDEEQAAKLSNWLISWFMENG